jgi:hypothetical protein
MSDPENIEVFNNLTDGEKIKMFPSIMPKLIINGENGIEKWKKIPEKDKDSARHKLETKVYELGFS